MLVERVLPSQSERPTWPLKAVPRTSRPRKLSKHKCLPLTAGIHFFNETAVNPLPLGMGWLSVENNKEDGAGMDPAPSVFCQSIFSIQMIAERSIVSR